MQMTVTPQPTGSPETDKGEPSGNSSDSAGAFLVDLFGQKVLGVPTERFFFLALAAGLFYYIYLVSEKRI